MRLIMLNVPNQHAIFTVIDFIEIVFFVSLFLFCNNAISKRRNGTG